MASKAATFLLAASFAITAASAFQFEVADEIGWSKPTGKERETYNEWAAQNRFHIRDTLRKFPTPNISNTFTNILISHSQTSKLFCIRFPLCERLGAGGHDCSDDQLTTTPATSKSARPSSYNRIALCDL